MALNITVVILNCNNSSTKISEFFHVFLPHLHTLPSLPESKIVCSKGQRIIYKKKVSSVVYSKFVIFTNRSYCTLGALNSGKVGPNCIDTIPENEAIDFGYDNW